jgi:hypothetical protein
MKRTALAVCVLLVLTSHARASHAADPLEDFPDAATGQDLFEEAHALIQKSRYSEACPKLEESVRLVPAVGAQLDLADCNEQIGKLATAWTGFLEVAARSKVSNQGEREKLARRRARALEPRVPKLVIDVPNAPLGVEVKRDGIAVDAAAWGKATPVDPGRHRVTVTAPGKQRWVTTVEIAEGATARVELPRELANAPDAPEPREVLASPGVPATPAEPVAPEVTAPAPPEPSEQAPSEQTTMKLSLDALRDSFPPPVLEEPGAKRRRLAWVVAAAGAVGLGVGTGFGLASLNNREDARSQCTGDACNANGVSLRDDAIRNGNLATASTVVGAAALVGGLVLMLTAPNRFEKRRSAQ